MRAERSGQMEALIVASLAFALRRQWNGNERRTLFDDIQRPVEPCHPRRHIVGGSVPALVLQRVDDPESDLARCPAEAACGAHVRRKQLAPATLVVSGPWMATTHAARRGESRHACPAAAADHRALAAVEQTFADDAAPWQEKIHELGRCRRGGWPTRSGALEGEHQRPSETAPHIAPRSGATPNHRSKASAPCSTSMPMPSAARWPRALSARTQAVSPRR